jgi:3-hydroxypropanoate dehydrogenase
MLDNQVLDTIFRTARTYHGWLDKPVSTATLQALWDLMKWGPTSANCSPARVLFVQTRQAKERLRPALSPNNLDKTMAAPVCAIIGYDTRFYEHLPQLFPANPDMQQRFANAPALAESTAFRNGTLQGAYFIIAARSLGLDCGAMSGFDNAKVDAEFFPDGRVKSNFLCNIGHGDPASIRPLSPRFTFDEACGIL